MNIKQGWLNIYKPTNISSFKVLKEIKKKFSFKKLGHAGTLDPLAKGILPIAIGNTTKLIPYLSDSLKTYEFSISWGTQTLTDDAEGAILFESNFIPIYENIVSKLNLFIGNINQTPPKASAVKINGRRAYKLLRQNKNFNIGPKQVYVKSLKIIDHSIKTTSFKIECGSGFYIRSLARDLSRELGTYGHISALERVKVGKFTKESSILLDDLLKMSQRLTEINCIFKSVSMLDDILAFEIDNKDQIKNISLGKAINFDDYKIEIKSSYSLDKKYIFLSNKGDIISVGELVGNLFKPKKVLI